MKSKNQPANFPLENWEYFYNLGIKTIKSLEAPDGILASSRQEIYGCIFGRDSLISALKLLEAYRFDPDKYYLNLTKKILSGLFALQGKETNIESGEEPGKCIHEFRITGHEHLTKHAIPPWYLYPDNTMRNYDSIDATPLFLIAIYRYCQKSDDQKFIKQNEENILAALDWIITLGDKNKDGFVDYQKHPERKSGGLQVQSWMDSTESVFHEDSVDVKFPVAPVEAQAYTYLAFKLWAKYFAQIDPQKSQALLQRAKKLKLYFNQHFILPRNDSLIFAHALDDNGKQLVSARSSIGHILWASLNKIDDNEFDLIIHKKCIKLLIKRLLENDIFEQEAGIRTLSKKSRVYDPVSYHNGSIWPHDNSLIAEGMEKLGYKKEATKIRLAIFQAYSFFKTPLELFSFDNNGYKQYISSSGQIACHEQAWSAASMIADALALKNS